MSGKDSVKFYPVGETVIVEIKGGVMECEVLNHLEDDQLYVEDKESKFRFLVSPSKVKKQKMFYKEREEGV